MNSLLNTVTGSVLIEKLLVRATFWGRLRGLLFHRGLETGAAMLLVATKRVHTHGMLFPLDLYFFNSSMCLIDSRNRVMPWKLPESPQGTQHILEIPYRAAAEPLRLDIGEQVSILWRIRS
jgi:uncharacterized membrane protein (UPF0127 family)